MKRGRFLRVLDLCLRVCFLVVFLRAPPPKSSIAPAPAPATGPGTGTGPGPAVAGVNFLNDFLFLPAFLYV